MLRISRDETGPRACPGRDCRRAAAIVV